MKTSPRNIIGIITTLFCVTTGVYTVFNGVSSGWRAIGVLVIVLGGIRAHVLLRDWQREKKWGQVTGDRTDWQRKNEEQRTREPEN